MDPPHARCMELDFPGTQQGFEAGFGQLRQGLDGCAIDPGRRYAIELVFEEIVANIVRYGAPPGGTVRVRVSLRLADDSTVLAFDDDGLPFDPTLNPDPPPAKSLAEASIGGRGIMLVRRAALGLEYRRTPERHNELVVTLPGATLRQGTDAA